MAKRDWYFQVPDTTKHIVDDEGDRCTCPNCLSCAERRAKEKDNRQLEFDLPLKIPIPYSVFKQ